MDVRVALWQDETGSWIAECLNLPGCVSEGTTEGEALLNVQAAIRGWLAVMKEDYPNLERRLPEVEVHSIHLAA